MSGDFKFTHFEWHVPAFREFRNSASVQAWVLAQGKKVAQEAGEGFDADVQSGRTRAQCRVYPVTEEADAKNKKDNRLIKAGGAGAQRRNQRKSGRISWRHKPRKPRKTKGSK